MTVSAGELVLYAGGLFVLFLTPGPVWLALLGRALSGGFGAAWPLALGVALGDMLWPFLAIMGLSWIVSEVAGVMTILRWVACGVFVWMGVATIRRAGAAIESADKLAVAGKWSGFMAGVAVILGNPKAVIFYMGVLPGFFDLRGLGWADIAAIVALSAIVPFVSNLGFVALVTRIRGLLSTPRALRRMNYASGGMLIAVGLILPLA